MLRSAADSYAKQLKQWCVCECVCVSVYLCVYVCVHVCVCMCAFQVPLEVPVKGVDMDIKDQWYLGLYFAEVQR